MDAGHLNLGRALEQWAAVLGDNGVLSDQTNVDWYSRTTGPGTAPRPGAILLPTNADQVRQIVEIAGTVKIPLHPISRGKNWGYGDASAPSNGQVIVDLQRMNRIIEVNTELAYAVIEPGVTQKQFSEYLAEHHPNLWMDCTGAGDDASIIGNTLERGYGHSIYGDRFASCCALQIVLPDARILETGIGHYPQAKAKWVFKHGVGPSLDGLFSQSNFGIVTRAGIWLTPKPEGFYAFFFSAPKDEDLESIIDRLAPLRVQRIIQSTLHIANDLRVVSAHTRYPWDAAGGKTPLPGDIRAQLKKKHGIGAWNGIGAIYGTKKSAKAVCDAVRTALRPYRLHFINDRKIAQARVVHRILRMFGAGDRLGELIDVVTPAYNLLKGQPSNQHLPGSAWRVRGEATLEARDPLETHAGLMWVSPILPLRGASAREVMGLIEPIYFEHGFEPLVTFTMITERAMVCVSNLAFDRREKEEADRALKCYNELTSTLFRHGYIPYRVGPHGYKKLHEDSSVFWDVARDLKKTLDPNEIISPGRYIPT